MARVVIVESMPDCMRKLTQNVRNIINLAPSDIFPSEKDYLLTREYSEESKGEPLPIANSFCWRAMSFKVFVLVVLLCLSRVGWATAPRLYSECIPIHQPHKFAAYTFTASSPCYPDLLDVGAEELIAGLENGAWSSVDLTKVGSLAVSQAR